MTLQGFVEMIVAFVREHESWAIPVAFLVAFGESFCFLSLLWPGTAILAGIAALIAASGIEAKIILPLVISAGLGGTAGYAASYWLGRYFETRIASIWPFTSHPQLIPQGERFFYRWGAWSVFFGHFFGPIRAVIPIVAGMFKMPQLAFQVANTASAFIWAAWVVASAFYLVTFKDEVFQFLRDHGWLVAAVMALLAALNAIPTAISAVPSLIAFIALAAFYLHAGGSWLLVLAAGAIGAVIGDLYVRARGQGHEQDLHAVFKGGWGEEAVRKARGLLARWGSFSLLPSKFLTTQRGMVPLAAGAGNAGLPAFLAMSVLSSAVWSGALTAPRPLAKVLLGW